MPAAEPPPQETSSVSFDAGPSSTLPASLPFPPLTKAHILACSFTSWYPTFRPHTPRARIVPLPPAFTAYLRSDGIVLPPSHPSTPRPSSPSAQSEDEGFFSSASSVSSTSSTSTATSDPSQLWPDTHAAIQSTIAELSGAVVPKLNWSAPKDAAWISTLNSLECRSANDVYLLLKSSDFVTHDLEHAFDGCVDWAPPSSSEAASGLDRGLALEQEIDYALILRKWFQLNPALEFRVFVRDDKILGIGQRDLNYYEFLAGLRPGLKEVIVGFWEREVKGRFAGGHESSYAMDVYVPPPHERCWVVDFNPWDRRTDPGLWSWLELLTMEEPGPMRNGKSGRASRKEQIGRGYVSDGDEKTVRLSMRPKNDAEGGKAKASDGHSNGSTTMATDEEDGEAAGTHSESDSEEYSDTDSDSDTEEEVPPLHDTPGPAFRLVERDDPEAYMFNSTRYSAHKLPRDVVDASQSGAGGLREFAEQWKDILEKRVREDEEVGSSGDDD